MIGCLKTLEVCVMEEEQQASMVKKYNIVWDDATAEVRARLK